jgi:sugar phosphate isomerase/epimerase
MKTGISFFYPSMDWIQNLKSAQILAKASREYGVPVAVENVPEPFPCLMKSIKDFENFYADMNEHIGIVLDVGHTNINRQTESFLRTFKHKIVHLHVSDNDGKSDQHLGVGWGTVNWRGLVSLLKELSYDRVVVIESVEHVEESLRKLKELLG